MERSDAVAEDVERSDAVGEEPNIFYHVTTKGGRIQTHKATRVVDVYSVS